ncbi:hypothetical protein [Erwinia phage FBB1]|nr:hypothetical protein [Erwinia phage FBB1]
MKDNFRRKDRKVIADSKSERDTRRANQTQEEALNEIHDKLEDVQSASELTSETIQQKSDEIINELANGIGDLSAGMELVAESAESTSNEMKKLNDTSSQISEKLSKLTDLLSKKIDQIPNNQAQNTPQLEAPSGSTALAVIADAIPDLQTDQDKITQAIQDLLPELDKVPQEDADFLDPKPIPVEDNPKKKTPTVPSEDNKNGKDKGGDTLKNLLKVTKDGFKTSIGFSDKIASMLFKYTVTAAVEAAKTAAMILSLVLAVDVIRINFAYWAKLFETNFSEFSKKAEEWGPLITDIVEAVKEIKTAWEKGDWSGLTIAIVKGVGKAVYDVLQLLILNISKLGANLLRQIPGAGDRALNLEGDSLETFQKSTGAQLSEEDQNTLAQYQVKKKDEELAYQDDHPNLDKKKYELMAIRGEISKDQFDEATKGRKKTAYDSMSQEDKIKAFKTKNEAEAAIVRMNDYIDNGSDSDSFRKSTSGGIKQIGDMINSDSIKDMPELKAELQNQFDSLNKKLDKKIPNTKVQPDSPNESQDSKAIERIEKNTTSKPIAQNNQGGNATVINAVNKNSTNTFTLPTMTATVAPGTHGRTSQVN